MTPTFSGRSSKACSCTPSVHLHCSIAHSNQIRTVLPKLSSNPTTSPTSPMHDPLMPTQRRPRMQHHHTRLLVLSHTNKPTSPDPSTSPIHQLLPRHVHIRSRLVPSLVRGSCRTGSAWSSDSSDERRACGWCDAGGEVGGEGEREEGAEGKDARPMEPTRVSWWATLSEEDEKEGWGGFRIVGAVMS